MKIPMEKIYDSAIEKYEVKLYVLRLDNPDSYRGHPHISGNKWFKLKYNLEEARKQKKDTLITFGGAYSNHIAAVAAAGKEFGFKTIGIIRGEDTCPNPTKGGKLNHVLKFAKECGMKLFFISREEYRSVRETRLNSS